MPQWEGAVCRLVDLLEPGILTLCRCTALQKAGGRAAVTEVALQGSDGGGWQPMNNVWGASWESASAPQPPLNVRITDDKGNTVCFGTYLV